MTGYELKSSARKLMADNAPKLFFVSILFLAIATLMSELQFRLPGTADVWTRYVDTLATGGRQTLGMIYSYFRPSGIPFAVVLWFLSSVVDAGYKSYCLKISRGSQGEYKDIFDGFLYFGKIMLIKLITSVLIALWSILFIFPGIVANYRYSQAYYILLDDPKKSALQCIEESKRLMRGKKLDLFLLDLSFLGWVILDLLVVILLPIPFSLPLISIWITPYRGLAFAGFYNRLIASIVV